MNAIETLATDSESNRRTLAKVGAGGPLVSLLVSSYLENLFDNVLVQVLRILTILRACLTESYSDYGLPLSISYDLIDSLTWVLKHPSCDRDSRSHAILFLRSMFQVMNENRHGILERLKSEFFGAVVQVLQARPILNPQTIKATMEVLLIACPWGSNKTKIVEAGAVKEIIENELKMLDKKTSELDLAILEQLCTCADGRERFLEHAAAIPLVTKRILRVSAAVDGKAMGILMSVCRLSSSGGITQEMLGVGGVSKLCMVLQANCETSVKEKAREILRLHSSVWKDSPCIAVYLLRRYPQH